MVFRSPATRWLVGLSGGLTIAAVSYLYLDGTAQLFAYGLALVDAFVTPFILKAAASGR